MKKDIIEYHPNGCKKYQMSFYNNGNKRHEQYYDQQGNYHRNPGLPDYQQWYENGIAYNKTYTVHGRRHNIHNPCVISFFKNGRILYKSYDLNNNIYSKLNWMNLIKNT